MDSRGSDGGAPDAPPADEDVASARGGDDGDRTHAASPAGSGPSDPATPAATPRPDRDGAAAPAADRPASPRAAPVAADPWPDADSLPWASGGPAGVPRSRPAPGDGSPSRSDETTEIISPDQVLPPSPRGLSEAGPSWAPPPSDPLAAGSPNGGAPGASTWAPPAGPTNGASPGTAWTPPPGGAYDAPPETSWAPPAGPPNESAPAHSAGRRWRRPGASFDGSGSHRGSGPGLADLIGGLARRLQGRERVVFAVAGVVLLVVAVAVVALGGDGGDGGGGGDDGEAEAAAPVTAAPLASGDGTDPTGPFVGPSGIVGWWSGSAWVPRPEGEAPEGGVLLTVVGTSGEARTTEGETVAEDCAAQEGTAGADVAVDLGGDGGAPPPIGVAGVAEPQPRPVETFSSPGPEYQQAAADVARMLGASTPPTVTQVVRSDLDGGGTFEVVVAAEHVADPGSPAAGDWSVVFLRRVVGNEVATHVLAASNVGGGAAGFDRIRISALADLNADGQMELVLDGRSASGRWTAIHALGADGTPAEVLRDGCDS